MSKVATASPVTRALSTENTIARLDGATKRQSAQLVKESLGKRKQGKPPWPQGSRPALRIQKAANERRAAAQAEADRLEAERLEAEAVLEAERQILEQERMLAEMEAWEREHGADGSTPPGSPGRMFLWDKFVNASLSVDEDLHVWLNLAPTVMTPRTAARLQAAEERRAAARLAEEEAEARRLAQEAEDARRYAALGTTRWMRADGDYDAGLIFAFLNTRGLRFDQGGWSLAQLLGQLSWQWRRTCLRWCKGVGKLRLRAGLDGGMCRWTGGAMAAIERTSPMLTALELQGLNGDALTGIELISSSLTLLSLSGCADVGPMLETTAFPRVHSLRIENCANLSSDAFRKIAKEWPMLKNLRLEGSTISRPLIISFARALSAGALLETVECTEPFPDDAIKAMSKTCPAVCSLVLPISGPFAVREPARCFPRLQRLRLGLQPNVPGVTKRAPCWTDAELQELAAGCPMLSDLHLADGRNGFTAMSGAGLAALPELTDLSLANLPSALDRDSMVECARALRKLRRLDLSDCTIPDARADVRGVADTVVAAFVSSCTALEELNLSGVSQLTNACFVKAKIACASLQHVDIGPGRACELGLIDGKGLLPLIDACPHLRTIRIGSPEAAASRISADGEIHRDVAKRTTMGAFMELEKRLERVNASRDASSKITLIIAEA